MENETILDLPCDKLVYNRETFRIIQSSFPRTGSTVLTNILYGIFCDSHVHVEHTGNTSWEGNKKLNVVKTHNTDFFSWMNEAPTRVTTIVITSDRRDRKKLSPSEHQNLVRIPYPFLAQENERRIAWAVYALLGTKLINLPDKETAISIATQRLRDMNVRYEQIKHKPFGYFDPKWHIHGSHRKQDRV